MAIELQHYNWPLAFVTNPDGTVSFGSVEQDTPADEKAICGLVVSTFRGQREDDQDFGVDVPLFEQAPLDVGLVADQLNQSVPDLHATATEAADAVARVRDITIHATVTPDA